MKNYKTDNLDSDLNLKPTETAARKERLRKWYRKGQVGDSKQHFGNNLELDRELDMWIQENLRGTDIEYFKPWRLMKNKRTRFFGIAPLNCGSIEILNIFNERNILRQIPLKHNNSTIKPLLATKLHEAFSNKKTDAKQDHFPMQMELGWCKITTFLVTP